MKQPTPLWQVISICVTVLLTCGAGILAQSKKIAKLEEKIETTERQFDRMSDKLDQVQLDIRQILVNLQNKQDRN
jgi:hypothetical protein